MALGRVLLVDDDRALRDAVGRALRLEGYDVVLAADGPEALEVMAHEHAVVGGIELQLDELEPALGGGFERLLIAVEAGASYQGAHASQELRHAERLHHVVIRTRLQTGDAVADSVSHPEHQYRHAGL